MPQQEPSKAIAAKTAPRTRKKIAALEKKVAMQHPQPKATVHIAAAPPVSETKTAPPAIPTPPVRKPLPKIPPILLEGDGPAAAPVSGPGQRYALGPLPPLEKLESEGELPESYGTNRLLLTARDPHWLYARTGTSRASSNCATTRSPPTDTSFSKYSWTRFHRRRWRKFTFTRNRGTGSSA